VYAWSRLSVQIDTLYPDGHLQKHGILFTILIYISNYNNNIGDNAAKNFMGLQVWSRYPHLYYPIPGSTPKAKCLCCLKEPKCYYYKNGTDVNYTNLFSHIAKQHPSMLLPEDVTKLTKEDEVENLLPSKRKEDPFTLTANAVSKRAAKEDLNELSKVIRDALVNEGKSINYTSTSRRHGHKLHEEASKQ
jgi:hypothetical protein